MSKNIVWENPKDELLDTPLDSKPVITEIEDIIDTDDTVSEEKNYIMRNGKKYYLTNEHYIYKCEDGYYSYRIIHKPSKTNSFVNRHINTKEKFNTVTKAKKAREEHILKLEINKTYKNRNVTFGDVWERIKDSSAKEEATITKYESIYKHHIKVRFGDTAIQDLSYKDINDYLELMYKMGDGKGTKQNGYSFTFVESILKFIWLVINSSFAYKVISADDLKVLTDNITMPKQQGEKEKRILNNKEIQDIYNLLKDTDYLLPFLISLYTGTRPAETFAIRFSDFDLENKTLNVNKQIVEFDGTLTVKPPKTFSRVIDIPDVLISEVKKRYEEIQKSRNKNSDKFELNRRRIIYALPDKKCMGLIYDDMISTDLNGKYNAASSFQYYSKIIRKEICLNDDKREKFSFYTFRKTALSIMASHSIPIGALMRITGHKKNQTLFEYYYSDENEFAQKKIKESVLSMNTLIKL